MQRRNSVILSVNKKFGRMVARGNPELSGFPPQTKHCFSITRHRRLAGRDPTARRWSPKAKCIKTRSAGTADPTQESRSLPLHAFHLRPSASSVDKNSPIFVFFRAFRGKNGFLCVFVSGVKLLYLKFRRSRLSS